LICHLSAAELAAKLRAKEISAREAAEAHLDRIEAKDEELQAFLTVTREGALAQADRAQELIDKGEGGALAGVPVAVKDNICTLGVETTCASQILKGFAPPYNATVVEKMEREGLVMVGKTNLDEFAMGTSCENSSFFPSRNPWGLDRSPGGSSGGSAAAVAGALAPIGLGSDTGGSIRMPGALSGVVGYKPTYGRVSRYGLVAFGSSLDQIGPFARTVEDAALLASVISGGDINDATSLTDGAIRCDALKEGSLKGLRVALPKELFGDAVQPGVRHRVEEAIALLSKEGAVISEVSVPSVALGVTTYYIIAPAEASSNLARYDGIRFGQRIEEGGHNDATAATRGRLFGHEVKLRIMVGTYALSAGYYDAYYHRAQQVRGLMASEFNQVFGEFDVVLSPTSPVVAFKLGELKDDQMALKLLDLCTIPANMGGFPAISLPCGLADGLPVGLQLMGPVMGDEALLQAALAVEQALPPIGLAPWAAEA
jgi:aspartyl-tRNA(Asn)/glutamyl-tRNA(Gln) amidotransferase subunit A